MKIGDLGKIRVGLFQEAEWKPESAETFALVFLCAGIFSMAFFAGAKIMEGRNKGTSSVLNGEKVFAAEDQIGKENISLEEDADPLKGEKTSQAMEGAKNSVKNIALKAAKAKRAARERAAFAAFIRSGPEPTGPTNRLSDGRRVCGKKNDRPQRGGAVHVDEDCCPDYDETPNPRCYYTPGQLGILK